MITLWMVNKTNQHAGNKLNQILPLGKMLPLKVASVDPAGLPASVGGDGAIVERFIMDSSAFSGIIPGVYLYNLCSSCTRPPICHLGRSASTPDWSLRIQHELHLHWFDETTQKGRGLDLDTQWLESNWSTSIIFAMFRPSIIQFINHNSQILSQHADQCWLDPCQRHRNTSSALRFSDAMNRKIFFWSSHLHTWAGSGPLHLLIPSASQLALCRSDWSGSCRRASVAPSLRKQSSHEIQRTPWWWRTPGKLHCSCCLSSNHLD